MKLCMQITSSRITPIRFRPVRFRPNDSGRTIQAGHDSGRTRFRPKILVTIQAGLDSGRSRFRPSMHDSGQRDTIQARHDSGRARFRPSTIQVEHNSGPYYEY